MDGNPNHYKDDHDLLVTINTKLEFVMKDMQEMKMGVTREISRLEHTKLDKDEANRLLKESEKIHDDHERRIRRNERVIYFGIGALAVIQLIVSITMK